MKRNYVCHLFFYCPDTNCTYNNVLKEIQQEICNKRGQRNKGKGEKN